MTHLKSERYLLGGTAKFFRQKVKSRRAKKAREQAQRRAQFRKGFIPKGRTPEGLKMSASSGVKPSLPTRGSNKSLTFKRRVRRLF